MKDKFCINCTHHRLHLEPHQSVGALMTDNCHYCAEKLITNPVTGESRMALCSSCRTFSKWCGPNGKWFEAKEEK